MKQKVLNKLCLLLPLVAAILLMPQRTVAQTTIAVLSDPHVMASSLIPTSPTVCADWDTDLANDRKMLHLSEAQLTKFKETLLANPPQLLLVTGDLTKDSEMASHNFVKGVLDDLKDAGIQTYVIPGNHDIGSDNAYDYSSGTKTAITGDGVMSTTAQFATQYAGHGYGDTSGKIEYDTYGLSYVTEPVPGLVLLAIDSHTGTIDYNTFEWLCGKAAEATSSGKQVIAMMHHPLIEHIKGASTFVSTYAAKCSDTDVYDYASMRDVLIASGVRVILTGHFHASDIAYDWNMVEDDGIYDINTGSLISYPCDYRTLTLSEDMQELQIATIKQIPTTMTEPECEEWQREHLITVATNKMNAKAGAYATYAGEIIDEVAAFAANLFIIHAEGDEPDNGKWNATYEGDGGVYAKATDLQQLADLAKNTFGFDFDIDFEGLAHSICEDKSDYDGAHVNVTADRNIANLGLRSLEENVELTVDGWASYCTGHDVDISKTDDVAAFIVSEITDEKVLLTEVTRVPAEQGFLLQGTYGLVYTLHPTSGVDPDNGNLLKGALVEMDAPDNCYVLSNSDPGTPATLGFYQFPETPGTPIPARKAYLELESGSGARMISLGGNVTGISTLNTSEKADQTIYTLQGTRAGRLQHGIYIQNGKKIIVK